MWCAHCKLDKCPDEFPRNKSMKSGRGKYCKECHNLRNRERVRRLHGDSRHYHLMQRYGVSAAEVEILKASQRGLCAVCERRAAVHVDHDHHTGRVRGILCELCNGFLGALDDDPGLIRSAIEYLETRG